MNASAPRDHGGNLDAAMARFGGSRPDWVDLSTGINPVPYPIPDLPDHSWAALPDSGATQALAQAARRFWNIPHEMAVLAAPGASALIARIPALASGTVDIPTPTYNEHAAAFVAQGWTIAAENANAKVIVHPNNPDGYLWDANETAPGFLIVDESFADIVPDQSFVAQSGRPGMVILKSFGKFWGLAGVRLGFAMGDPDMIDQLKGLLGPWPVSGPALAIGTAALSDHAWAVETRKRLDSDANRLDVLMQKLGANPVGGTSLFRLYDTDDAVEWQLRLAQQKIWSRIFPYSDRWLRLGLPHPDRWPQLDALL